MKGEGRQGADINKAAGDGTTVLFVAAWCGHAEVVQALLAGGADTESTYLGATPLSVAIQNGHEAVVKILQAAARTNSFITGSSDANITLIDGEQENPVRNPDDPLSASTAKKRGEGEAELEQEDAKRVAFEDLGNAEHFVSSEENHAANKRTEGDAELEQRDGKRRNESE